MNKPLIEIFGRDGCAWCARAKALLQRRNYRFVYRSLSENPGLVSELNRRAPDAKTLPQIFVGSRHIGGFTSLEALDATGELQQLIGGM